PGDFKPKSDVPKKRECNMQRKIRLPSGYSLKCAFDLRTVEIRLTRRQPPTALTSKIPGHSIPCDARSNDLALPDHREAGRRRHGGGVQGRGHAPASLHCAEVSA